MTNVNLTRSTLLASTLIGKKTKDFLPDNVEGVKYDGHPSWTSDDQGGIELRNDLVKYTIAGKDPELEENELLTYKTETVVKRDDASGNLAPVEEYRVGSDLFFPSDVHASAYRSSDDGAYNGRIHTVTMDIEPGVDNKANGVNPDRYTFKDTNFDGKIDQRSHEIEFISLRGWMNEIDYDDNQDGHFERTETFLDEGM